MSTRVILAGAFSLTICVSACGGGSGPVGAASPTAPAPATPTPPPPPLAASGDNWTLRFEGFTNVGLTGGYGKTVPLAALEGSFNTSPDGVSAMFQPFGSCFVPDRDRVRFRGTRSGNAIEMETTDGMMIRIKATLSADGKYVQGTYAITAGCGAGAAGSFVGRRVNLTGVWAGTMGAIPVVLNVQMAPTPDSDAGYALSGTATFSNTVCLPSAVITRRGRGRVLFPDITGGNQRLELIVEVSEDLMTMHINSVLVEGTCPELKFVTGIVSRQ